MLLPPRNPVIWPMWLPGYYSQRIEFTSLVVNVCQHHWDRPRGLSNQCGKASGSLWRVLKPRLPKFGPLSVCLGRGSVSWGSNVLLRVCK